MPEIRYNDAGNLLIPNSTQIPNVLIDELLPVVNPGLCKIILVVARKTYGWRKEWDALSERQIAKLTGLSERYVIDSLDELAAATVILRREPTSGRTREDAREYSLNVNCDLSKAIEMLRPKERKPRPKTGGKKKPSGEPSSAPMEQSSGTEPSSTDVVNPVPNSVEPSSPQVLNPVQQQKLNDLNQQEETKLNQESLQGINGSKASSYPSPTTASSSARARQKPLRFSQPRAPRQNSLPGIVKKKPEPLTFPEELAQGLREIWLPTDNQAIAQIWRECRANVPDLTVSELMFFAWEKAGPIKNAKTPVGLMIHSLPLACNPQGVDALREDMRKREATRRAEIEQQEAEDRRWQEAEDRRDQAVKLAEEKLDAMAETERVQILQETRAQLLRDNPSYSVVPNFEQTVRGCALVKFRKEFEILLWKESWKKSSTMGSGP